MPLPEYLTPVLTAGGPIALVLILLRFGPDAVVRLVAGTAAVFIKDEKRGERCLKVLRILRKMDDSPEVRLEPPPHPASDTADGPKRDA